MHSSELPMYYWDACVPLSYINGIPDRLQHIESWMSKSGAEFQLVTSALSIVEVAFAAKEKDNATLDTGTELKISKLWQVGSPIVIVEFYELIAVKAQSLMRAALPRGWSLKPADAIHLATADQLEVMEFHTYDAPLEKFSVLTETKFKIGPPISQAPHLLLEGEPNQDNVTHGSLPQRIHLLAQAGAIPTPFGVAHIAPILKGDFTPVAIAAALADHTENSNESVNNGVRPWFRNVGVGLYTSIDRSSDSI